MMIARLIPLVFFFGLAAMLMLALGRGKPVPPPAIVGKPVPVASLAGLDPEAFKKGPVLVNFFASWCAPCAEEQPLLAEIAAAGGAPLYGIAYKDAPEKTQDFLARYGNPFVAVGQDAAGTAALDWGVYGVPETYFILDGNVVWRHAGPLTAEIYRDKLAPMLKRAKTP